MKKDLYTKVLLTAITLFLGVLAAEKILEVTIPEAEAGNGKWSCFSDENLDDLAYAANRRDWTYMTFEAGNGKWNFCGR